MKIDKKKLDTLIQEIERIRRRKIVDYSSQSEIEYIDPFDNLKKIKQLNNHLIIGRRGSGKTTLLLTTINKDSNNILHPRDCQIFRNWEKEKILTSIITVLFSDLSKRLITDPKYKNAENNFNKYCKGFINNIKSKFSKNNKKKEYEKEYSEYLLLTITLKRIIEHLDKLDKLPNKITYKYNNSTSKNTKNHSESESDIKLVNSLKAEGKLTKSFANISAKIDLYCTIQESNSSTFDETKKSNEYHEYEKVFDKFQELNGLILDFSAVFSEYTRLTNKTTILYLDDFYLIPVTIQPYIAQFLHDIYKNSEYSAFCFKICTIPNRIRLNINDSVDFSYKDDYSPIKLDKELSELNNLKDYLIKILISIKPELNLHVKEISGLFNNEEVLLYTIIATGGVPRDFLISFSDLINEAKTDKYNINIKKEHLYSVISNLKEDKDNNIEVDTDIDPEIIKKAIGIIEKEIIEELKTNVILYPSNLNKDHELILKNLINLRYIHIINENISSEKVKKESFVAYLIDMTFYATGKRLKTGFNFREFWRKDGDSHYPSLRSAPIWYFKSDITPIKTTNITKQ